MILKVNTIHVDVRKTLWFLNGQISHVISHNFFTQFSYFTGIILLAMYLNIDLWLIIADLPTALSLMSLLLLGGAWRTVFYAAAYAWCAGFSSIQFTSSTTLALRIIRFVHRDGNLWVYDLKRDQWFLLRSGAGCQLEHDFLDQSFIVFSQPYMLKQSLCIDSFERVFLETFIQKVSKFIWDRFRERRHGLLDNFEHRCARI